MTKHPSDNQPVDEQTNTEDAPAQHSDQTTPADDQLSAEDLEAIAGGGDDDPPGGPGIPIMW